MADVRDDDDNIFVYMGGDQRVPSGVRRIRIHKDVKIVLAWAFYEREHLISVEFHDGVEIIETMAFYKCKSLKSVKLLGVKIIKEYAFYCCYGLMGVEFCDKLETIEQQAFNSCMKLKNIVMPSDVRIIGAHAFSFCYDFSEVKFGKGLRTLQQWAFSSCPQLKRVALPLKDDMIEDNVFGYCDKLVTVDLTGEVHQTIASLHFESWRKEMKGEINLINQTLPTTPYRDGKTEEIQRWMRRVSRQLNHYKTEHKALLKEATTLLELALWKANLDENGRGKLDREGVRTTRGSRKRARKEICVTSGASIVIKNVLPFLQLLE